MMLPAGDQLSRPLCTIGQWSHWAGSALALIRIGSNGGDVKLVLRDFGGPRSGY